jgi:hypothetical protein
MLEELLWCFTIKSCRFWPLWRCLLSSWFLTVTAPTRVCAPHSRTQLQQWLVSLLTSSHRSPSKRGLIQRHRSVTNEHHSTADEADDRAVSYTQRGRSTNGRLAALQVCTCTIDSLSQMLYVTLSASPHHHRLNKAECTAKQSFVHPAASIS